MDKAIGNVCTWTFYWGQCSLLVAHWPLVAGDHGSGLDGGGNFIPLLFLHCDLLVTIYLRIN